MLAYGAATVSGAKFAEMGMGIRRLAILLVLFAFVAKLVSPCEASAAAAAVGASDAPVVKCHLSTTTSLGQGDSNPAPSDQLAHDGCSCALCQIGWSAPPPADNLFAIHGLAYHDAPRAPPAQAFVASRPNRSAPPRGPPSFA